MTSELERIKILEGKISQVVEYISKLMNENDKLKQQVKELKEENKQFQSDIKQAGQLDQAMKNMEQEREVIKGKIESIITQIDQLEI